MPPAHTTHRYTREDVEAAFARFKALSEDRDGELERIGAGSLAIYRVQRGMLAGFIAYGAYPAILAINCFCRGYHHGAIAYSLGPCGTDARLDADAPEVKPGGKLT